MSPPNVLITQHGEVKIVDFGLAKASTQLEKSEPGIIKGKFSYLAPEAAKGQEVDARADIFAIGIMLWELLAGRRLFMGKTDLETVQMVQRAIIPPITRIRPDVPPELEPILARALAAEPSQRYTTARELGADLNAFLFRYGNHAVTDFEVADLVRSAMEQRRREREAARSTGVEEFLQWAEQAVFQFQSIDAQNDAGSVALDLNSFGAPVSSGGHTPLQLGGASGGRAMPSAGDLSALEEPPGANPVAMGRTVPTATPMMSPFAGQSLSQAQAQISAQPPRAAEPATQPAKSSGLATKIGLVLLAIGAVVGGLFASGIFKH
jgi:serine/threonine-protein kinase